MSLLPRRAAAAAKVHGARGRTCHAAVRSPRASSNSSSSHSPSSSLPSIREFIASEAPVRSRDGTWREQPARPGTELTDAPLIQLPGQEGLLVPGQRQLMYVINGTTDAIVAAEGAVALAVVELPPGSRQGAPPNLVGPNRGSWAVSGRVCGVQRLPGNQALVRVLVTDRIAVQALSRPSPDVMFARSIVLRDRWCFFVRRATLDAHLGSSSSTPAAGRDVLTAVDQVQDAASEVLSLLRQLAGSVRAAVDAAEGGGGGGGGRPMGQELAKYEAADELEELLAWCGVEEEATSPASAAAELLPADAQLMERAWRLSFAPFAAAGLAAALGCASSTRSGAQEALEMTDLGLRLEAAADIASDARRQLAARLGLEGLGAGGV